MKKRIVTLVVFLLIACLMLTSCSSGDGAKDNTENPTNVPEQTEQVEVTTEPTQTENQTTDGMYEWTVRGVTVRTKTNIMNYIHGNVWDERRMSVDLGWAEPLDPIENPKWYLKLADYKTEKVHVRLLREPVKDATTEKVCYGIVYLFGDQLHQYYVEFADVYDAGKHCEYYMNHEDGKSTIPFDCIVYYTCILERLSDNTDVDPLEDIIGPLPYKRYVYTL